MISNVKHLLVTLLRAMGLALGSAAPALAGDGGDARDATETPPAEKDGDKDDGEEWTEEDEYGW